MPVIEMDESEMKSGNQRTLARDSEAHSSCIRGHALKTDNLHDERSPITHEDSRSFPLSESAGARAYTYPGDSSWIRAAFLYHAPRADRCGFSDAIPEADLQITQDGYMHNPHNLILGHERTRRSLINEWTSVGQQLQPQAKRADQSANEPVATFYQRPTTIFAAQPVASTPSSSFIPVVAIAIACVSLILGFFCASITMNKSRRQEQASGGIIPSNIHTTCTSSDKLTQLMTWNGDIEPRGQPETFKDYEPGVVTPFHRHYQSVARPEAVQSSGRERVGLQHLSCVPSFTGNQSPNQSSTFMDVAQLKDEIPIQTFIPSPAHTKHQIPPMWKHSQNHDVKYIGPEKSFDQKTVPQLEDAWKSRSTQGAGSVVQPENLARECYPHRTLASSTPRNSVSRNSWMLKCPPSLILKPKEAQSTDLSNLCKPQPVRKLKESFGVGFDTEQVDANPERSPKVTGSDKGDDELLENSGVFFHGESSGADRRERNSFVSRFTPGDHSSDLEPNTDLTSNERPNQTNSTKRLSHKKPQSPCPQILDLPAMKLLSPKTSVSSDHRSAHYLSLSGLSRVPELTVGFNSTENYPEKSGIKMNSLATLGNKFSSLTSPSSSKNEVSRDILPAIMKRASFHPSLNWGRRKKSSGRDWKRVNSVSSHTRSQLTNSVSSDALTRVYSKKANRSNLEFSDALDCSGTTRYGSCLDGERRRLQRHKHSKSVPENIFMSQLRFDAEVEFESRLNLNVMNPDRESLGSGVVQDQNTKDSKEGSTPQLSPKLITETPLRARDELPDEDEDSVSVYSSSNSSACQTPTMEKTYRSLSFQLGDPPLNQSISQSDHEVRVPKFLDSTSHPSTRIAPHQPPSPTPSFDPLGTYLNEKLLSTGPTQTAAQASLNMNRKQTLHCLEGKLDVERNSAVCKREGSEVEGQDIAPPTLPSLNPVYNIPLSTVPPASAHQQHISKSVSCSNQSSSSMKRDGFTSPEPRTSLDLLHDPPVVHESPFTNRSPAISLSSAQVSGILHRNSENPSPEPRPRSTTEIQIRKDRYLSGGEISVTSSSDDLSSFGTGAASVNSEPQWKSRLNSVGSFVTNQSFEEQGSLWIANPDGTYSPSLESLFNHSSKRLTVSPT
ncbi:hypothetical protein CROQUDRAFT_650458 [Cronartium quercuum f. sp. fusiforme G11]|uniref:Uncharacterized protein n=1 Tax=Cronartium quercuum f. sp. fusiforme G11 TaxID=708437 RepID=A0A9P6NUJ1_9BASI|nr:hypothetical protein CROQUDRAFT_650458 [Cronartium quercuum f. sp. fusiforme G11]